MNINRTLKTYEDGSELKAAYLLIPLAATVVATGAFAWVDSVRMKRRTRRWNKFWEDKGVNPEIN